MRAVLISPDTAALNAALVSVTTLVAMRARKAEVRIRRFVQVIILFT